MVKLASILDHNDQPENPFRGARLLLLVAVIGITAAALAALIAKVGRSNPNIDADYLTAVGWGLVLGCSILAWPISRHDKKVILILWAARCFVALSVMLFYELEYGGT